MDKAQASRDVADQGPPGAPPPHSGRPRDEDRLTRKPLTVWDRIKFLLLLVLLWFVLVWSAMANNPLVGCSGRSTSSSASARSPTTGSGPKPCSAASSGSPTGGSRTGPGSASGGC